MSVSLANVKTFLTGTWDEKVRVFLVFALMFAAGGYVTSVLSPLIFEPDPARAPLLGATATAVLGTIIKIS